MSKNGKMVLFFLAATVFNIVLMVGFLVVFFIAGSLIPVPSLKVVIVVVGFVAAIVLTFLVYGKTMKWATVRFKLEQHIPQLFKGRRK